MNKSMNQGLNFTKMHGLGNDFIVLNALNTPIELTPQQVRNMADRHTGIGCDQVLLIKPSKHADADFYYQIFNADGGQVAQCGNGARCVGRYLSVKKITSKNKIVLHTDTSLIEVIPSTGDEVSVNLGRPSFAPETIPFVSDQRLSTYTLSTPLQEMPQVDCVILSLGNPHAVIHLNNVAQAPVELLGKYFNNSPLFPAGVNVEFMQILRKNFIQCRIYERGVGETRACGSGACAAVIAGVMLGLLEEDVTVSLPGGKLKISWQGGDHPVWMTGPAVLVFDGYYPLFN